MPPENQSETALINAKMDELRSVVYSLADKLSAAVERMDAATSELASSAREVKGFKSEEHKKGIVTDVSYAVSDMFAKHPKAEEVAAVFAAAVSNELDEKLAKLAELEAELLLKAREASQSAHQTSSAIAQFDGKFASIADSLSEVRAAVSRQGEDTSKAGRKVEGLGEQFEKTLDGKLSKLAELEAELLRMEKENADAIAKMPALSKELMKNSSESTAAVSRIADFMGKFEAAGNRDELVVNAVGNLAKELDQTRQFMQEKLVSSQQASSAKAEATALETKALANRTEELSNSLRSFNGSHEESYAAIHAALHKIADNQNKVNALLAESLGTLIESTESLQAQIEQTRQSLSKIGSKLESALTPEEMEKRVEEKLAKKLSGN